MDKIWLIRMPSSPINYIMKRNPVCWFTQGTVVLILINIVRNNDIAVDLGLHNQCRPIATLNCVKYLPHYSLYLGRWFTGPRCRWYSVCSTEEHWYDKVSIVRGSELFSWPAVCMILNDDHVFSLTSSILFLSEVGVYIVHLEGVDITSMDYDGHVR